ncbi:MAG TPA: diacylglycerol kinase family protein [Mycobacteriales bacterium]|nr:diacylglycerol kinase family protein [Mycobacteriales bacterium]
MSAPAQHRPAATERWLARLALLAILVAALLPLAAAGWRGLLLPFVIGGHLVLIVIGAWLALAHRGALRVIGIVLVVGAVVVAAVLVIRANLLWVVIVSAALLVLAAMAGRAALRRGLLRPYRTEEVAVGPPSQPFMIMNPRSGGGKVVRFGLREKAEELGAEVAVLEGPGTVDVAQLARDAVARGADLLGVAGGDGTQALVAAVAAQHDIPLLVISAGTRNHFALDLGLDREDPSTCLEALRNGVELRVDLGDVNGRPFVNNVSFGAYAAIVERPEYRDEKLKTTLDLLPDLLTSATGPRLVAHADAVTVQSPQALLVSNNPYDTGDIAGLGRRPRMDGGVLGVIGVRAANAVQAARMLRGRRAPGLTLIVTEEVVVDADVEAIPAGVDGESVRLTTPVRCRVRPGALRVRVPRDRPGVPPPTPTLQLSALLALAVPGRRDGRVPAAVPAEG